MNEPDPRYAMTAAEKAAFHAGHLTGRHQKAPMLSRITLDGADQVVVSRAREELTRTRAALAAGGTDPWRTVGRLEVTVESLLRLLDEGEARRG